MSIWDDEFDEDLDKYDFECWLDSVNKSGDPDMDEYYYNREMTKQVEYPDVVVQSPNYIMTYSNN